MHLRHPESCVSSQRLTEPHSCQKAGSTCDYSVRLNWTGRPSRTGNIIPGSSSFLGGSAAAKPAVGSVAAARGPLPRADSTLNPPTFIITNNGSFTASPTSPSPMQSSDSPMLEAVSEGNQGSVREPRILGSGLQTPMLPSPSLSAIPVDKDSDVMNDEPPADRPSKRVQLGATRSGRSVMPTPTGTGCAPNLPQTPALLPEAASTRSLPRAGISMPSAEDGQTREADLQLRLRSGDSRLTVSSLLTASLPDPGSAEAAAFQGHPEHSPDSAKTPVADEPTVFYGVDHGLPDLDLGKNNDGEAIDSGSAHTDGNRSEKRVEAGGYYEKPVSIYIPRRLEPLPAKLMENPMNLLVWRPSPYTRHQSCVLTSFSTSITSSQKPPTSSFRSTMNSPTPSAAFCRKWPFGTTTFSHCYWLTARLTAPVSFSTPSRPRASPCGYRTSSLPCAMP